MKRIVRALLVIFIVILAANLTINTWLASEVDELIYEQTAQIPFHKYALVLGTVKYDDQGGVYQSYSNRINSAAQLYKKGKVKYLIVSSSNSRKYMYNATTMKEDLVGKGIPAGFIIVDTGGVRTIASVKRCKRIFHIDSVTIVSQARHCQRAVFLAQHFNLHAIAYAAPAGDIRTHLGSIVHEQAARFMMLYDLYIRKRKN
jgi:SanA protein